MTKYPPCLCNNKDLQLGKVYSRHLYIENLPSLLTIYELEKPATQALNEINNIIKELNKDENSVYAIRGMFSLGIAHFETMLSDLIIKQLQFFPQKISSLKKQTSEFKKETKEIFISQASINKGIIVEDIIQIEVNKLAYENIEILLDSFSNVLSIELTKAKTYIDELIEIKETRNLLIHNNLLVNEIYF